MKELTRAEEQFMQVLWELKSASIKDIVAYLHEPRPKYTTVSTIIRILEKKEFVGHTAKGRNFIYHPLVDKKQYARFLMRNLLSKYFQNSIRQMVYFLSHEKNLTSSELEEIRNLIDVEIRRKDEPGQDMIK
ncbi:MAG: BlaI/MecI/CopY family transcriptional regulator [Bacteroidota bacterium]